MCVCTWCAHTLCAHTLPYVHIPCPCPEPYLATYTLHPVDAQQAITCPGQRVPRTMDATNARLLHKPHTAHVYSYFMSLSSVIVVSVISNSVQKQGMRGINKQGTRYIYTQKWKTSYSSRGVHPEAGKPRSLPGFMPLLRNLPEVPLNNMHNNKWLVKFCHCHVRVWYLQ